MAVPQIFKIKLPYDLATPFLGLYPKELKGSQREIFHTGAYSISVHYSQEMEATQTPIKGWIDKQMWSIHIMEYYSVLKQKEILPQATT